MICGTTTSLSTFAVFESRYATTVQVNANGSSTFSATRGSIPVKFDLLLDGVPTCQLPLATIAVTRTASTAPGQANGSIGLPPGEGAAFGVTGCGYHDNLDAKPLGPGTIPR